MGGGAQMFLALPSASPLKMVYALLVERVYVTIINGPEICYAKRRR